jgi:type II secretory pathway component PulF
MFKPLMSKFALSRFSRIFSSLNASGLPIMQTLAISTETIGNPTAAPPDGDGG